MSYSQADLHHTSTFLYGAQPQARANAHPVPIDSSLVYWLPDNVSLPTVIAASDMGPLAAIPPDAAALAIPPAIIVHILELTNTVNELQRQLQAARHQLQLQRPPLTVNPAQLSGAHAVRPAPASSTLRRPTDHQQRAERRKALRKQLNRNGNRCCAWCEPRRERRKYEARQVPEGEMTCGCTVEDALFEETLARNGVGSMNTKRQRLDPELRRALLALLKKQYKYRDGDLDYDHDTLAWKSGGDAASWMARVKFDESVPGACHKSATPDVKL